MAGVVPFKQGVIIISGATRSGKTTFVRKMIKNISNVYAYPAPEKILFCYAVYQPLYDKIKSENNQIEFKKGLPNEDEIEQWNYDQEPDVHKLIILDDLHHLLVNDRGIDLLLTQGSHHKNISVIIIAQNIFGQGKYSRNQSLNTQYFIIFRNLRDATQIKYLGRQLFPSSPNKLVYAYEDCIKDQSYGYLVIDMHPSSEDTHRLRSKIFPEEDCVVYM
jgi:hypothetical protein